MKLKPKIKNAISGYLFVSTVLIGVIVFTYIPAIQSLVYSFFETDGFLKMNFVGVDNFVRLFTMDRETSTVFGNTFLYSLVTVPLGLILGYAVALLANMKLRGITAFRVLFYLPVIIPAVSAGLLWRDLFDPSFGIMAQIFRTLGLGEPTFFSEANTSMATLIWTNVWGVGGSMIIWLAAFKNIPVSLYESAKIEGAGALRRVVSITIPLSAPMIFYNLVLSVIGSLQTFQTMIIAGGTSGKGVGDSLYFIAVKIYTEAFTRGDMGYACSVAWVLFLIIAILTWLMFRANKRISYGEDF